MSSKSYRRFGCSGDAIRPCGAPPPFVKPMVSLTPLEVKATQQLTEEVFVADSTKGSDVCLRALLPTVLCLQWRHLPSLMDALQPIAELLESER